MITNNQKDFIEKVTATSQRYKLMALDYGDKKIGIAFCSSDTHIATPYKTMDRKNADSDIKALNLLINDNKISGIIMGLPLKPDGTEGSTAKKVRKFAEKLYNSSGLPITFEDERYSTFIANDMLIQVGLNRKKRAKVDDQVSAQVILDSFIRKNGL